jgi:hypothetical protein
VVEDVAVGSVSRRSTAGTQFGLSWQLGAHTVDATAGYDNESDSLLTQFSSLRRQTLSEIFLALDFNDCRYLGNYGILWCVLSALFRPPSIPQVHTSSVSVQALSSGTYATSHSTKVYDILCRLFTLSSPLSA